MCCGVTYIMGTIFICPWPYREFTKNEKLLASLAPDHPLNHHQSSEFTKPGLFALKTSCDCYF